LAAALGDAGIPIVSRDLPAGTNKRDVTAATGKAEAGDAVVLWLRPNDIAALGAAPAPARAYISGRMGGLDNAPLPASWRGITHMAYPFDLPAGRRVQMDYPLGWFRIRKIPVVAEQVQADTYLVCGIVSDTINHMVDTFVRDYLVERVEGMLEHRLITGYYPRLALAPGQRFASKGGYVVHFAEEKGSKVVADGGWIVP
jgi:hypothetical protein